MVAHIDGNESNGAAENLGPTCRSCNTKIAHVIKRHGIGRRTRQYNPRGEGAQTLAQWMAAVMSMKGESDQMPLDLKQAGLEPTRELPIDGTCM
jgi:hypothetical protein